MSRKDKKKKFWVRVYCFDGEDDTEVCVTVEADNERQASRQALRRVHAQDMSVVGIGLMDVYADNSIR